MGPLAMSDSSLAARSRISSNAMAISGIVGETAVAIRENEIQRGRRHRRAALSGNGEGARGFSSAVQDEAAKLAVVHAAPRPEVDRIGVALGETSDRGQDRAELHLVPWPRRVQQRPSTDGDSISAHRLAQREPPLVAARVA